MKNVQIYTLSETMSVSGSSDRLHQLSLDKYFEVVSITPITTENTINTDRHGDVIGGHDRVNDILVVYKTSNVFKRILNKTDSMLSFEFGSHVFVDSFVNLRCDKRNREYVIEFFVAGAWETVVNRLKELISTDDPDIKKGLRHIEDFLYRRSAGRFNRDHNTNVEKYNEGDIREFVEDMINKMNIEPTASGGYNVEMVKKDISDAYEAIRYLLKPGEISCVINWVTL